MPKSKTPRVLVVDDKFEMAEMVADGLGDHGYEAVPVASGREALARLKAERFDAVVTDLRMPEVDGLELLAVSRSLVPERPVLVMTAYGAIDSAVESIRLGAYHYFTKPFKTTELALFLGRALEERTIREEARALKQTLRERYSPGNLHAQSPAMRRVLDVVERVAPTDTPLLLRGETGTGKGLLAETIHAMSPRAARRLVPVNCAALPEQLLESELFGHVKGAFTGASRDKPGLFAEADGGTLFLDEIGEMSPALQAKLLHVLETGQVRPVGATEERMVDVRIICATHRDLSQRIREGQFREDLLYRLDVVGVEIPPLRRRREDIPALIHHFLERAKAKHPTSPVTHVEAPALQALLDYPWPGNVRELSHLMERLVLLGRTPDLGLRDLPQNVVSPSSSSGINFQGVVVPIRKLHHRYAVWALEQLGGHKSRTAESLDIDFKTLAKWLDDADRDVASPSKLPTDGPA